MTCNHTEANKDRFKYFLVLHNNNNGNGSDTDNAENNSNERNIGNQQDKKESNAINFENYIQKMRKSGERDSNLKLIAIAQVFGRKITIYLTSSPITIDHGIRNINKGILNPDILLIFHQNHYSFIQKEYHTRLSASINKSEEQKMKEEHLMILPSSRSNQ